MAIIIDFKKAAKKKPPVAPPLDAELDTADSAPEPPPGRRRLPASFGGLCGALWWGLSALVACSVIALKNLWKLVVDLLLLILCIVTFGMLG